MISDTRDDENTNDGDMRKPHLHDGGGIGSTTGRRKVEGVDERTQETVWKRRTTKTTHEQHDDTCEDGLRGEASESPN